MKIIWTLAFTILLHTILYETDLLLGITFADPKQPICVVTGLPAKYVAPFACFIAKYSLKLYGQSYPSKVGREGEG